MRKPHCIMFANRSLEERFRCAVNDNADVEIGGYLLVSASRHTIDLRELRKASIHPRWMHTIHSFILAPNLSEKPEREFQVLNHKYIHRLASLTADAMGLFPLDFHTHPNGNPRPSLGDIRYMCSTYPGGYAEFVIVSPRPARLTPYVMPFDVDVNHVNDDDILEPGVYLSWRELALRRIGEAAE